MTHELSQGTKGALFELPFGWFQREAKGKPVHFRDHRKTLQRLVRVGTRTELANVSTLVVWFGLVWFGLVWFGLVWLVGLLMVGWPVDCFNRLFLIALRRGAPRLSLAGAEPCPHGRFAGAGPENPAGVLWLCLLNVPFRGCLRLAGLWSVILPCLGSTLVGSILLNPVTDAFYRWIFTSCKPLFSHSSLWIKVLGSLGVYPTTSVIL